LSNNNVKNPISLVDPIAAKIFELSQKDTTLDVTELLKNVPSKIKDKINESYEKIAKKQISAEVSSTDPFTAPYQIGTTETGTVGKGA
jgi:hypothetical protein